MMNNDDKDDNSISANKKDEKMMTKMMTSILTVAVGVN